MTETIMKIEFSKITYQVEISVYAKEPYGAGYLISRATFACPKDVKVNRTLVEHFSLALNKLGGMDGTAKN